MKNIHTIFKRCKALGILFLMASLLVAGCSGYRDMPPRKLAEGELFFVSGRFGGFSSNPELKPESHGTIIMSNGYTERKQLGLSITKGYLTAQELEELKDKIARVDFKTIRENKFTGNCRYSGEDIKIYKFYYEDGVEEIKECNVEIRKSYPALNYIDELFEKYHHHDDLIF